MLLMRQYMAEQQRVSEVEDSIRYARHLQNALLPSENNLREMGGDVFLINSPRNVLSGDFSWYTRSGSRLILCVADCTGHGIPGALMSVLGLSLLNQVVLEERSYDPSHILRRIDEKMRVAFQHAEDAPRSTYDGMDIALCSIDLAARKLSFAGAMRPCWLMREGELIEMAGSRYPIGGMRIEGERQYPATEIDFTPGDLIYMFTDGYTDQFGGADNKKLGRGRLRELLKKIHKLPAKQQKDQLQELFLLWRGLNEQTDDATMIGLRL
jgi:serine phosphatase RsbU (regulator of sigma subunit)